MGKKLLRIGIRMNETRLLKKLPMLSALPTSADVRKLLSKASESVGLRIQMSWISDANNNSYNLSCKITNSEKDPEWSLSAGGIVSVEKNLWVHTTGDTELILNLALMESGAETTVEQNHKSMTLNSAPILPPIADDEQSVTGNHPYLVANTQTTQSSAPSAGPSIASDSLQGNLADMPLAGVLQSISMTKMTGRLSVEQDVETANIYFEDGVPVHAVCLESDGDFALLELVSWDVGKFRFFNAERTTSRTVKKRLQSALIEGTVLSDQHRYLIGRGLQPNTYLLKANPNLSEAEFERTILAESSATDIHVPKRLYVNINGCTLSELLMDMSVRKAEWVPAMYHLLSNNLIKLSDKPALQSMQSMLELVDIDVSTVAKAHDGILRADTGALGFPLFMYFVQQEHFRFQRTGLPYALIIFELAVTVDGKAHVPSPPIQKGILRVINSAIRKTDLVGHFRTFEFGLLLPNTNTHGAIVTAKKLLTKLIETGVEGAPAGALHASMGLASLPADVPSPDLLIAASLDAKKVARKTGQPIVSFKSSYT